MRSHCMAHEISTAHDMHNGTCHIASGSQRDALGMFFLFPTNIDMFVLPDRGDLVDINDTPTSDFIR